MTTRSTAKKSLQNFHARTNLWRMFEQKAQEMDCSVDYLINEAMRMYATAHGMHEAAPQVEQPATPPPLRSTVSDRRAPPARPSAPPPLPRPGGASPPIPRPGGTGSGGTGSGSIPIPRPGDTGGGARPSLTIVFQGNKIPITGDQFIIGRGSKSSDLTIKDANISRKHAAVIFHNGTYYMKDLGSTNGVEFNGSQIDSKRIDEGDSFSICGYEMHFTYNA